jgi:prevent-host-death family protein
VTELAVSEARKHFVDAVAQVRRTGEPIYVTRGGLRVAAIVDAETYDQVVGAAEDALDRRELDTARSESNFSPWQEVKTDLVLE